MAEQTPSKKPVTGRTRDLVIAIDRFLLWFTDHWIAFFNTILGIYVGLPILAPTLMRLGVTGPARLIYRIYSPFCHQSASRSIFLFGEQWFYPSEVAGTTNFAPLQSYATSLPEFAGIDLGNFFLFFEAARRFLGNPQMGYKTALCARDMGIYSAIFLTGIAYALLRNRIKIPKLSFLLFILIAIVPIGWDGFSQLFGYYAEITGSEFLQTIFYKRESTPLIRTTTGLLFGFGVVWLAYPHLDEGMAGTRYQLRSKLIKAGVIDGEIGPAPWELTNDELTNDE